MKKKILVAVLSALSAFSLFGLVACGGGGNGGDGAHTHSYSQRVVDATCDTDGYTEFTCSCGDKYVANKVDALGHDCTDYEYNNDATFEADGTETAKCNRCGEQDTRTVAGTMKIRFTFEEVEGGYALVNYNGEGEEEVAELVIPATYNDQPVVRIKSMTDGFNGYYKAKTKIVIPDSVKTIDDEVFASCSELVEIDLGGVETIGKKAFYYCPKLEKITISSSLKTLDLYAFKETKVKEIYYEGTADEWAQIDIKEGYDESGNYSFATDAMPQDTNTLLYLNGELATNVVFTEVTEIKPYTFSCFKSIETITFNNDLEVIGKGAFSDLQNVEKIVLPDSVTTVETYAFNGCGAFSVTLGANLQTIGEYAFSMGNLVEVVTKSTTITKDIIGNNYQYGCVGLNALSVIEDESDTNLQVIGDYLFFSGENRQANDRVDSYLLKYYGDDTEIVLPSSLSFGDYRIFDRVFKNNEQITKVIIPDCVINIGEQSFYNCVNLAEVIIGDGLTSIGREAFDSCTSLNSIDLNNVSSVGYAAFRNCSNLYSVVIKARYSVDDAAFAGCYRLVEVINLTTAQLEPGYTSLGGVAKYALKIFEARQSSSNIITTEDGFVVYVLGSTYNIINYVGESTEITIPNTIDGNAVKLASYAFAWNENISSVEIEGAVEGVGITEIADHAFAYNKNLMSVTIGEGVKTIGESAFSQCYGLSTIVIPESITSIGGYAFYYCQKITEINLGDNVTIIGVSAFENCSYLETFTVGNSLAIIENSAFSWCPKLTEVVLPDTVIYIGNYAFRWCSSITTFSMGNGVVEIGYYAFANCQKIEQLVLPSTLQTIGYNAFANCEALTSITVDNLITVISREAFYGCYNANEITLGDNVQTIEQSAFAYCHRLQTINMGANVTSIGSSAVLSFENLVTINYYGTVAEWNAIEKADDWFVPYYDGCTYKVVCSDGEVNP